MLVPFSYNEAGEMVFTWFDRSTITICVFAADRFSLFLWCFGIIPRGQSWAGFIFSELHLRGYWLCFTFLVMEQILMVWETNAASNFDLVLVAQSRMSLREEIPFDSRRYSKARSFQVKCHSKVYLAGIFLQKNGNNFKTVRTLLVWSIGLAFSATFWDIVFPYKREIWGPAFLCPTTCGKRLGWSLSRFDLVYWDSATGKAGLISSRFCRNPLIPLWSFRMNCNFYYLHWPDWRNLA